MHAAVLTDLEIREVKAERLRLPDELVQLSIRLAGSPRRGERILYPEKVVDQLIRARVGQGEVRAAGCSDSLGNEQEELAVGLPWRPPANRRCASAGDLSRDAKAAEKACVGRRGRVVGGQPSADAGARSFQTAKNVLGLDEQGLAGDLSGDVRVPVSITADPAAEPQKRRCGWEACARILGVERRAELPVDRGNQTEQRLIEDPHESADLIERLQLLAPQLGGPPEPVDLLEQPAPGLRRQLI